MTRILRSRRRRRRLLWLAALAVVAGGASAVGVLYTDTGEKGIAKPRPGQPQRVARPRKTVPFAPEEADVRRAAAAFVETAVFRRHLERSYDLVVPSRHDGLSRKQWARGNIPVVPYPPELVSSIRWKLDYSYEHVVGLKLAFLPPATARARAQVFDIELTERGAGSHRRWLVDSWTPAGGPYTVSVPRGAPAAASSPSKARLGRAWLLVPLALIGGTIVLVPAWLFGMSWMRARRARRAFG